MVLAESIDRISRDQEDIVGIFKRLTFAGIRMITLSEGDVSELYIGLKGTMGALYLKDLADKTRREQLRPFGRPEHRARRPVGHRRAADQSGGGCGGPPDLLGVRAGRVAPGDRARPAPRGKSRSKRPPVGRLDDFTKVDDLVQAPQASEIPNHVAEILRGLIDTIVLKPEAEGHALVHRGDLAGILALACGGQGKSAAAGVPAAVPQVSLVAGARFGLWRTHEIDIG